MPGIVDANITCLNRGSLKKAIINIKAHNRSQLDIIDALYMRLGYTVLLEWGNSSYINNNGKKKTIDNFPFVAEWWHKGVGSENQKTIPKILETILENKRKTGGKVLSNRVTKLRETK